MPDFKSFNYPLIKKINEPNLLMSISLVNIIIAYNPGRGVFFIFFFFLFFLILLNLAFQNLTLIL